MNKSISIAGQKNIIVNAAVFLLAVFIAYHIYNKFQQEKQRLLSDIDTEKKRQALFGDISGLEDKVASCKGLFVRKETGQLVDMLAALGKDIDVKVISVTPGKQDSQKEFYNLSWFNVQVEAADYHSLGKFINRIETGKEYYLISSLNIVRIDAAYSGQPGPAKEKLSVEMAVENIYLRE